MSTIAFIDNIPSATAKTGYLTGIVASGATDGHLSVTNTGDVPANFNYRTPGQTVWTPKTLNPLSSEEFTFVYNSNDLRTIEYTFDAGVIQLSVVDWWTQGSSDAPITVITDGTPGGSAGSPKVGDVSSGISAGTTIGTFLFTNTGDAPLTLNVRKTGTTIYDQFQLNPMTSTERRIALTSARTIEYYFDASAITVKVVDTTVTTTIPLTDVESWLTMYGYDVGDSGNITRAQVQLCINRATSEVTDAEKIFKLLSMNTALSNTKKNSTILDGSIAHALRAIGNKDAAAGYEQHSGRISEQERVTLISKFETAIAKIESGIYQYGA